MKVIDSTYEEVECKLKGRCPKKKLVKDGSSYIFKYGSTNFQIYAELIAEQIGKQMGITMAHYDMANKDGIYGVLTPNFLKPCEMIISSLALRKSIDEICDENDISLDLSENVVTNIVTSAYVYDKTIDTKKITYELMKRWVFYGLIMESDKNNTNISFIKAPNGKLRLSPDYDNSTMARLNENIYDFLSGLNSGVSIYNYTDSIKQELKIHKDDPDSFLESFGTFASKYESSCEKIIKCLKNVDVEKAIEIVEKDNEIKIPHFINFWVLKVIEARKEDILLIYKNSIEKNKSNNRK